MVDKSLVSKKLQRIEKHLEQVRRKKDPGIKLFTEDTDLQSIVRFNLIQIIQSCIDIGAHIISDSGWDVPATQAEIFRTLSDNKVISKPLAGRMVNMAGFRNLIVHEYDRTDMKIVHEIWKKRLSDIEKFCEAVVVKYNL